MYFCSVPSLWLIIHTEKNEEEFLPYVVICTTYNTKPNRNFIIYNDTEKKNRSQIYLAAQRLSL